MRVVINIQNELLLEFHQPNQLTDLCAFWYFAVRLNEGTDFFTTGQTNVTFRCVSIDAHKLRLLFYCC